MATELKLTVQQAVYEALEKTQPDLVAAIAEMVKAGASPEQVGRAVLRAGGTDAIRYSAETVAEYLQRNRAELPGDQPEPDKSRDEKQGESGAEERTM